MTQIIISIPKENKNPMNGGKTVNEWAGSGRSMRRCVEYFIGKGFIFLLPVKACNGSGRGVIICCFW